MIKSILDLRDYLSVELVKYPVHPLIYLFQGSEAAVLRKHQILLRKTEYYVNCNKKYAVRGLDTD